MTRQFIRRLVGAGVLISGIYIFLTFFTVNYRPEFYDNWFSYLSRPGLFLIISVFLFWVAASSVVKWQMICAKDQILMNIVSSLLFLLLVYLFWKGSLRLFDEPITITFYAAVISWFLTDIADLFIFSKDSLVAPELPPTETNQN